MGNQNMFSLKNKHNTNIMKLKIFISFASCFCILSRQLAFAQAKFSKIRIDNQFKDTLHLLIIGITQLVFIRMTVLGNFSLLATRLTQHIYFLRRTVQRTYKVATKSDIALPTESKTI